MTSAPPSSPQPDSPDAAPSVTPGAPDRAPVDVAACAQQLKTLFPALFGGAPKPLKLRIQADIQERAPGQFSKQQLSAFLRRYTGSTSYLIALTRGTQRFDLDGQPQGELSEEHRQVAAAELARRRANQDARRAQEEQGRRDRANLLRDFERTTLTQANFCALKGLTPEILEQQLNLARQEAQERRQQPSGEAPDARRGPRRHGGPTRQEASRVGKGDGPSRGRPGP